MKGWKSTLVLGRVAGCKAHQELARCWEGVRTHVIGMHVRMSQASIILANRLRETKGQGTTEYAILVGVIVVIAIIAIVAFRDKLQNLWESISNGINGL